ncbi:hypothetical protein E2C01_045036 [Portunus trituberculatus]|uniref:Uncharacterized protein n=1 Tax=Portunus trituberculatus TaxID=210409 RepID=A0A5B7G0Y3_PORTR|nr:hypothetical protein [Portunus trituberculatus]
MHFHLEFGPSCRVIAPPSPTTPPLTDCMEVRRHGKQRSMVQMPSLNIKWLPQEPARQWLHLASLVRFSSFKPRPHQCIQTKPTETHKRLLEEADSSL